MPRMRINTGSAAAKAAAPLRILPARGARLPETQPLLAGRKARELLARVAHVKRLVFENAREDRAGDRIDVENFSIDDEAAGGRFLREVQEGEQRFVALRLDAEIVEPALARRQPVRLEARGARAA